MTRAPAVAVRAAVRPTAEVAERQEPAADPDDLPAVWASMRSAAGHGALQALLAALEPVSLESDVLSVRGRRYDVTLVEQRASDLATLATRARQRPTTLKAEAIDEQPPSTDAGPAQSPVEAAMQIPLVRQTAELFEGTVVRALRRTDTDR